MEIGIYDFAEVFPDPRTDETIPTADRFRSHGEAAFEEARELSGLESVDSREEGEVGIVGIPALHPDQVLDHLGSGRRCPFDQVLAGKRGVIESAPRQDVRTRV